MKIALLFEYSTLNGGERSMLATLDWLRANHASFEFVAIASTTGRLSKELSERQIEVVHWSPLDETGARIPSDVSERSLIDVVKRLQPDLLHANSLSMGRLTGRLASQFGIRVSAHLRDIIKLSSNAVAALNGNHRLIAVSHATCDFHVRQGLDPDRVSVVHNGVDLTQFQPRPATGQLLSELNVPRETGGKSNHRIRIIMTIGQIGLRKGQNVLVAAAPGIVEKIPEAHFVIVGERNSNKAESIQFERDVVEGLQKNGLADRLHLLGYRDDVAKLLNEADLLVHTAMQEPLGRVLLESLASGLPIVATDVGGTREIIVDQVTGVLVPPNQPASLVAAVTQILTDDSFSDRLRIMSRSRAESFFSIEFAAKSLADVWTATLDDSRTTS